MSQRPKILVVLLQDSKLAVLWQDSKLVVLLQDSNLHNFDCVAALTLWDNSRVEWIAKTLRVSGGISILGGFGLSGRIDVWINEFSVVVVRRMWNIVITYSQISSDILSIWYCQLRNVAWSQSSLQLVPFSMMLVEISVLFIFYLKGGFRINAYIQNFLDWINFYALLDFLMGSFISFDPFFRIISIKCISSHTWLAWFSL